MSKKLIIIISIIFVITVLILATILGYNNGLKPVNKDNNETKIIEISQGTRTEEIINILKEQKLIRSSLATKIYIKLNKINNLQGGQNPITFTNQQPHFLKNQTPRQRLKKLHPQIKDKK